MLVRRPRGRDRDGHHDEASADPEMMRRDAVFAFLAAHRGESFCAECIADALSISWIDASLSVVGGRGVRRREGQCARCRQRRLVSGSTR